MKNLILLLITFSFLNFSLAFAQTENLSSQEQLIQWAQQNSKILKKISKNFITYRVYTQPDYSKKQAIYWAGRSVFAPIEFACDKMYHGLGGIIKDDHVSLTLAFLGGGIGFFTAAPLCIMSSPVTVPSALVLGFTKGAFEQGVSSKIYKYSFESHMKKNFRPGLMDNMSDILNEMTGQELLQLDQQLYGKTPVIAMHSVAYTPQVVSMEGPLNNNGRLIVNFLLNRIMNKLDMDHQTTLQEKFSIFVDQQKTPEEQIRTILIMYVMAANFELSKTEWVYLSNASNDGHFKFSRLISSLGLGLGRLNVNQVSLGLFLEMIDELQKKAKSSRE